MKYYEVDFGYLPVNAELLGMNISKPFPLVVVFRNGREIGRRTISLSEASLKTAAERFEKRLAGLLEKPDPPQGRRRRF